MKSCQSYVFALIVMVSLVASLFACSNGCYSQDLILKADWPVPICTTTDAALFGKASSMLSKGQQVPIRECIDIKHYQIYKVELSAGVIGYVNDGK